LDDLNNVRNNFGLDTLALRNDPPSRTVQSSRQLMPSGQLVSVSRSETPFPTSVHGDAADLLFALFTDQSAVKAKSPQTGTRKRTLFSA
jgi:hypothetical protein